MGRATWKGTEAPGSVSAQLRLSSINSTALCVSHLECESSSPRLGCPWCRHVEQRQVCPANVKTVKVLVAPSFWLFATPRTVPCISCIAGGFFNLWATRGVRSQVMPKLLSAHHPALWSSSCLTHWDIFLHIWGHSPARLSTCGAAVPTTMKIRPLLRGTFSQYCREQLLFLHTEGPYSLLLGEWRE